MTYPIPLTSEQADVFYNILKDCPEGSAIIAQPILFNERDNVTGVDELRFLKLDPAEAKRVTKLMEEIKAARKPALQKESALRCSVCQLGAQVGKLITTPSGYIVHSDDCLDAHNKILEVLALRYEVVESE